MKARRKHGNVLILVLVTIGVIGALIAFLILNYTGLFSSHKQTMAAGDATTLQVAKDIGRIVVDGPLGRIALVDDPQSNNSNHPVQGINTVYAKLRVASLVANKLSDNSKKVMVYMIKSDLAQANAARDLLKQKIALAIQGTNAGYDKNGAVVDVKGNAQRTYLADRQRTSRDMKDTKNLPQITIELGTFKGGGTDVTDIAVPYPNGGDTIAYTDTNTAMNNNRRVYRAGVDIPLAGITGATVRFAPITSSTSIVEPSAFKPAADTDIPVAVKVTVVEPLTGIAGVPKEPGKPTVRPTAQLVAPIFARPGNSTFVPATGTLLLGFGAGFPTEPAGALTFSKGIDGIINASSLDANNSSQYGGGWNTSAKGNWSVAANGPVPGSGQLVAKNFKGLAGRAHDDPSVSLAFITYDWIKSVGLRANPDAVAKALKADFKTFALGGGGSATYTANGFTFEQPAYADEDRVDGTTTPALNISESLRDETGGDDPRNLRRWNENPEAYQRQQARMWGYIPADPVIGPRAYMGVLTDDGTYLTMDGNPSSDMFEMQYKMMITNQRALQTFHSAVRAFAKRYNDENGKPGQPIPELGTKAEFDEAIERERTESGAKVLAKYPRIDNALNNSCYVSDVSNEMYNHLKVLTGGGVRKVSDKLFVVMGENFYPIEHAATAEELLGDKPVPTQQDKTAPAQDWTVPAMAVGKEFKSRLEIYKHKAEPVIGRRIIKDNLLLPAYAASAKPNNSFKLLFKVEGGTSTNADGAVVPDGTGTIKLYNLANTPFANVATLQGQAHYQMSQALKITEKDGSMVTWQVQARDLNANAYPETTNASSAPPSPSSASKHYSEATTFDKSWCAEQAGCPTLASEWAVTCPVVTPPPPPPPPPPATVPPYTPPPNPCAGSYAVSRRWVCGWSIFGPLTCCTLDFYNGCGQWIGSAHS